MPPSGLCCHQVYAHGAHAHMWAKLSYMENQAKVNIYVSKLQKGKSD